MSKRVQWRAGRCAEERGTGWLTADRGRTFGGRGLRGLEMAPERAGAHGTRRTLIESIQRTAALASRGAGGLDSSRRIGHPTGSRGVS